MKTLLVCLLLALVVTPASAEFTEAEAEALAYEAYQAVRASDWETFAAYLHPDDSSSFAGAFVTLAERDDTGEVREMFFGGLEMAGIGKLSDEEVCVRVMEALMALVPGFDEMLASMEMDVLGSVQEGDMFHVVSRMHADVMGTPFSQIDVSTIKPFEGELRTALSGDLEELVQGIVDSME